MREALGLAPKTSGRSHGNRLDKHEFSELVKRGSTAEDLGAGHAEAARVQGLGFLRLEIIQRSHTYLLFLSFQYNFNYMEFSLLSGCAVSKLGMDGNFAHQSTIRIRRQCLKIKNKLFL